MAIPVTSGLQLLLDPAVLSSTDGTTITSLADQSGQGNNASVPSGCTGPTYKTNIVGTRPALRFSAAAHGLSGSFASWTGAAGSTVIIAVTNVSVRTSTGSIVGLAPTGGNDYNGTGGMVLTSSSSSPTNYVAWYVNSATVVGGAPMITMPTKPTVMGFGNSSTTEVFGANGANVGAVTASNATANAATYALGQRINGGVVSTNNGTNMDFLMTAVYSRLLTDSEAASVMQWMMQQLGTLPTSSGSGSGGISRGRMIN